MLAWPPPFSTAPSQFPKLAPLPENALNVFFLTLDYNKRDYNQTQITLYSAGYTEKHLETQYRSCLQGIIVGSTGFIYWWGNWGSEVRHLIKIGAARGVDRSPSPCCCCTRPLHHKGRLSRNRNFTPRRSHHLTLTVITERLSKIPGAPFVSPNNETKGLHLEFVGRGSGTGDESRAFVLNYIPSSLYSFWDRILLNGLGLSSLPSSCLSLLK